MKLNIWEIFFRMLIATIFAGVIGHDRESKNRPAGIRTHILVCLGATAIALVQKQIEYETISLALEYPELNGVIKSDPSRLIAQVVSGIGFLGAGTIMVTRRWITGLTTAASLWAVACLGLAVGMGFYRISFVLFISIFLALTVMKNLIRVRDTKQIEIEYTNAIETEKYIEDYFKKSDIDIKGVNYSAETIEGINNYTVYYTIELPKEFNYVSIVEDLSRHGDISKIKVVAVGVA